MSDDHLIHYRPLTDTPADEPDERRRAVIRQEQGQPFEHFFPECGRWGSSGFGCDLAKGITGTWYCGKHKALGEKTGRLS